jgi:DNA-directed RNA polymerase subunit RPC12/RpoP
VKLNQNFICENCREHVPIHPSSSRDHCNYCLYGKHVDINPGDRLNNCKGKLEPIGIEIKNGKERIVYKCMNCQKQVKCITAPDDNKKEIQKLYKQIWVDRSNEK